MKFSLKYTFKLVKNCQPVIQSVCTILHFYWCYMRVSILLYLHNACYCFLNGHPSEFEVIAHCCFDYISTWLMRLRIFSCVYWIFQSLLWGNIYSDSLSLFKLSLFFVVSSLYILKRFMIC